MEILRVNELLKTYGNKQSKVTAIKGISFRVNKGEFVAIVGPSGSGKSTLLHILAGLEPPTSGSVVIDNVDIYSLSDDQLTIFRRRQIGMIYQFYNLIPTLTVRENIILPLLLDNKEIEQTYLNQIIASLHIEDELENYPSQLSGGQQQRVAIARALIHHPALILADEPTGNLDSLNSREIVDLLKLSNAATKATIILITHDMNIAMQANRIFKIERGELSEFEENQ